MNTRHRCIYHNLVISDHKESLRPRPDIVTTYHRASAHYTMKQYAKAERLSSYSRSLLTAIET